MAFDPWSAGAAAVPAIFQGISGIIQSNKGKRMAQNNIRPVYSRPTEVGQGLALAEQAYLNGGMPGSAVARNNVSSAGATALDNITQAASSGADVLDGISKVQYNEGLQTNDIATQEAAYKKQQLGQYQDQLANSAQYADKEFSYNKDAPYQTTAAAASALIGAGNTNVGNSVNNLGSLATTIGLNGGFNGKSENTNQLGSLPSSAAGIKVNPGMGGKMVWDPYTKKLKVQ